MIRYRFPILLAICLGYLGLTPVETRQDRLKGFYGTSPVIISLSVNAQEEVPESSYDRYMREGYQATQVREYQQALEHFQNALRERPEDTYAQRAIDNVTNYIAQQPSLPNVENNGESSSLPANSIWLIAGVVLLSLAMLGAFISFIAMFSKGKKLTTAEKSSTKNQPPFFNFEHPQEHQEKASAENYHSANNADEREKEESFEAGLPVQSTTRIPSLDVIEELIKNLEDPDAKNRRKAIWKLAQVSDSRAMKPLVDLMIQTDSYERSLILEALSQVCSRTLRPMNQALAVSLQDKNSQVRKNAIRDLTRLYDLMSQISELLCYALDDDSLEVQETAKWALDKLNLRMPIKLNLGTMDDEDESVFEDDEIEDAEFE